MRMLYHFAFSPKFSSNFFWTLTTEILPLFYDKVTLYEYYGLYHRPYNLTVAHCDYNFPQTFRYGIIIKVHIPLVLPFSFTFFELCLVWHAKVCLQGLSFTDMDKCKSEKNICCFILTTYLPLKISSLHKIVKVWGIKCKDIYNKSSEM